MRRRDFVKAAAAGVGAAAISSSMGGCDRDPEAGKGGGDSGPGREPAAFQRWTWVHGSGSRTPEEWRDQYRLLARAGFTGVLVGGGDTGIHAAAAHEAGLEFHRWVWTLNRNGDEWVKENHPEWFTVSRRGEPSLTHPPYVDYYKWLCPTRTEVREYLRDSILELARDPDVDGIHLDYVRHCDVILPRGLWEKYGLIQNQEHPEFDFCYCQACREAFERLHQVDPMDLADPPGDERWRRFRWDSVSGLVSVLAEAVHEVPATGFGKALPSRLGGKPITAAVFPTPSIARRLVRQAWDQWPLDAVFPMLYHSFYLEGLDWIGQGVEEGLAAMESRGSDEPSPGRLVAGLYLPALSPEDRVSAVEIARAAGAEGVSFFEMNGLELEGDPDQGS